jgi:hypothetical protein
MGGTRQVAEGSRLRPRLRWDLLLLFALGVVVIWLPPRPPMIDLAQHAGQVSLMDDLLLGRSQWSGDVKLNFFTPYLIGYLLASPLMLFMPAAAALKTVLTVAYAAFIGACLLIRRELNVSPKLDSLYTLPFFGLAYGWGLYTFLVAAPVGLGFVWLCLKYSRQPRLGWGLAVAGTGLALLFCHGLVFLLTAGIGGLLVLANARTTDLRTLALRCWPFLLPLLMCGLVFVLTSRHELAMDHQFGSKIEMQSPRVRLRTIIGSLGGPSTLWSAMIFLPLLVLPLAARLRIAWDRERLVIFGVVASTLLFAPEFVWSTALIYPRLTLFVLPAYAWLFSATPMESRMGSMVQPWLRPAVSAVCVLSLGIHLGQAYLFSRETRDFEAVLEKAQPRQRALSLIFDNRSDAGVTAPYLHFPAWYQADKHGFVDFNFAVSHIEIVRFRRHSLFDDDFAWNPDRFRWNIHGGSTYRYFFVRSSSPLPSNLFAGADCQPVLIAQSGLWKLFEHRSCRG